MRNLDGDIRDAVRFFWEKRHTQSATQGGGIDIDRGGRAAVTGGKQQVYGLSLVWTPTEYVKFIANYGHLELTDAAVLAGGSGDYSADVIGIRAQIDF